MFGSLKPQSGAHPNTELAICRSFFAVMLAFVVFRAENISQAWNIIAAMFVSDNSQSVLKIDSWMYVVLSVFVVMMATQWWMRERELSTVVNALHPILRGLFISFLLLFILLSTGNSNAFIYFQF